MSKISTVGKHNVQIAATRWEEIEGDNGAPNYLALVLTGMNSKEETAEKRLYFSTDFCKGGKFTGQPRVKESIATCIELGMKEPFNPTSTGPLPYDASKDELYGATCEFVMVNDEKYGIHVKYLNTKRREAVAPDRLKEMWGTLAGAASQPAPATITQPKAPSSLDIDDDNIPFGK